MKFKSLMVSAALLGLQASAASAALVTDWNWAVTSKFVAPTTFGNNYGAPSGPGGTPAVDGAGVWISWGPNNAISNDPLTATARSGLRWGATVTDPPLLQTNDITVPIGVLGNTMTHFNRTLTNPVTVLQTGKIDVTLNLTPALPVPGAPLAPFNFQFEFVFVETPNSGPCVAGGDANGCHDVFILKGGPVSANFTYDGVNYVLSVGALINGTSALQNLPNALCTSFSHVNTEIANCGTANLVGFTTPESQDTDIVFPFSITGTEIPTNLPEPSALALFGAGLLGFGYASRRRKSA
jgi:hypothetical protein